MKTAKTVASRIFCGGRFLALNFDNIFDSSLRLKTFRDVPKEK